MKNNFNPWPLGIVLAFAIFIASMAAAVVIACTHGDSLVTRDYYEQELKFQSQIDGAARARQAGAGISRDSAGDIAIQLPAAQLAEKIAGEIELYRPSAAGLDRTLPFAPDAQGRQIIKAADLAAGSWVMRVKWNARGENYFLEQKIKI